MPDGSGCFKAALLPLESELKQGLVARCFRVLSYPLKNRIKAGLSKASLPDASGCFSTRFKSALKLV